MKHLTCSLLIILTLTACRAPSEDRPDRAKAMMERNRHDSAATLLHAYLQDNGKDWNAKTDLAVCLHYLDKTDSALLVLDEIIQDTAVPCADRPELLQIAAIYSGMRERLNDAIRYWQTVLTTLETCPDAIVTRETALVNLCWLHANTGKYELAFSSAEKALVESQDSAFYFGQIGYIYDKMGEHAKSSSAYLEQVRLLKQAVPLDSTWVPDALANAAAQYQSLGQLDTGCILFQEAIDWGLKEPDTLMLRRCR